MGNQQVTEYDVAWLAGIYDGEGWFSLKHKHTNRDGWSGVNLSIGIVNTDSAIINRVDWLLDGIEVPHVIREKVHDKWKTRYDIEVKKFSHAKVLISRLLPYLIGKRGQAELLLRFINRRLNLPKHSKYKKEDIAIMQEYKTKYARTKGTSTTIRREAGCSV